MTEAFLSQQPYSTVLNTGFDIDPTKTRVQVSFNQRGVDIHIPPVRYLWKGTRRYFWSSVNKVAATVYPLPLSLVLAVAAGTAGYVFYAPPTAYIHTNPVSTWLRYVGSIDPLTQFIPSRYQATALCVKVWVVALGGATVLHRFFLRRLLRYRRWMTEKNPRHPGWRTRLWSTVTRVLFTHRTIQKTDVYEHCLPTLPLPSLQSTVSTYLNSMRVIYDQQADLTDWLEIRRAAESFLLNEGPVLQRNLRLHHVVSRNYVSEWWTKNVFLAARQGLCMHSNYYAIPFAGFSPATTPEARAAVVTYNLVQLKERIERRQLPPQFTGPGLCVPLSMHQCYLAFNTTRIPGRETDFIEHHGGDEHNYIIVLHHGRVYQFPVCHPRTHQQLTPCQMEKLFRTILQEADEEISTGRDESEEESEGAEEPVRATKQRSYRLAEMLLPTLTTAPRSVWADLRNTYLLNDANNHSPLRTIEKALFVLTFEDRISSASTPVGDLDSECTQYLCGNGSNLWCDKSFNVVVRSDGRVGVHVEHSWGDAGTFLSLFEHVSSLDETRKQYTPDGRGAARMPKEKDLSPDVLKELTPHRLRFTMHKKLAKSIRMVHTNYLMDTASQVDLHVVRYTRYGKNLPTTLDCSADAWAQMAIQLAYYIDQEGHLNQIHESIPLHMYTLGRTETVRSVSDESCAFVLGMTARNAKGEDVEERTVEEKHKLLLTACEHHERLLQEATAGHGVDRHLFALYMVSAAMQMPSDFLNAVMRKTKWKVSTQRAFQRYFAEDYLYHHAVGDARPFETPGMGFAPAVEDGYGISYCFNGDHVVYFTITCQKDCEKTSARELGLRLVEALDAMGEISEVDLDTLSGEEVIEFDQLQKEAETAAVKKS